MKVILEESGQLDALSNLIDNLRKEHPPKSLMILSCDANAWDPAQATSFFQSLPFPVFGGIFPQIIWGLKNFAKGTLVVALPCPADILTLNDISAQNANFETQLESFCSLSESDLNRGDETCFIFVDGLSKGISVLMEKLFYNLGCVETFIGGGAGSLSFNAKPCVISNAGLSMDSAVLVRVKMACGVGVTHGWSPISPTMEITGSQGNVVETINWKPAFAVYREMVEAHSHKSFASVPFFDLAKSYPLGIARLDAEFIVRDPFAVDGEKLVCVADVPQGSFVQLLHGDPESLIKAASMAVGAAEKALKTKKMPEFAMVIDCISRALFLESDITRELQAISTDGVLFGALTIGEIASNGHDFLEFFNKTTVVGVFGPADD